MIRNADLIRFVTIATILRQITSGRALFRAGRVFYHVHREALTPVPAGAIQTNVPIKPRRNLRRIVADAPRHLAPSGWLLLEHGWDQAAAVRELLHAQGLVQVQSRRDLGSHERCSGAQKAARAQGSQAGPPCA